MKIIILLLLCSLSSFLSGQNRNFDQELVDILFSENPDIFAAVDFNDQYGDSLQHPFSKDLYQVMVDIYMGRVDSAGAHIPHFLDKYYGNILDDGVKMNFLNELLDLYTNSENYNAAVEQLDVIKPFVESSYIFDTNREFNLLEIERLKNLYRGKAASPFRLVNPWGKEYITVDLDSGFFVEFHAELNDITLPVVFDTGAGFPLVMRKEMADKIGVRMLEDYQTKIINNVETTSAFGILDSMKIGSLRLENVSVYVFEEDLFKRCLEDSVFSETRRDFEAEHFQVVMGLPLIRKLNWVRLDREKNRMTVSPWKKNPMSQSPNMYTRKQLLYIGAKINNKNFTMFWDTGGDIAENVLMIQNSFYEKNLAGTLNLDPEKKDSLRLCGAEGVSRYYFNKPKDLKLEIAGHTIDLTDESMILSGEEEGHIAELAKEGFMGFGFLRKVKSITFDFHSMRMDFIPKD
ncbi:MAG: retropepsin-like domain-containing protein [Bacteroidales bacterium]|nr:retropepsin-like domain-containing protein [Bacteroidales bacterium]